jgi:hypothetical protein
MTIREIIRQGLHYARTCKSLWVFGFVVGLTSGGSSGGGSGGGGQAGGGAVALPLALSNPAFLALVIPLLIAVVLLAVIALVVHFLSEGALIEGVVRARAGGRMTMREGVRAGWKHWGVLLRIALIYFALILGSLALLAAPCVIAIRAGGPVAGIIMGVPALVVAVPWLITLHLIQAFATRIAVLENRRAFDAVRKARLFLHGRLRHGLRLIVATFVGTLVIAIPGVAVIAAIVVPMVALVPLIGFKAIVAGSLLLLPVGFVFAAVLGTFRSSVWTIGYVTEVQA